MSAWAAAVALTLLTLGIMLSFVVAAFRNNVPLVVISWLLGAIIGVVRHFTNRCPQCGKSMYTIHVPHLSRLQRFWSVRPRFWPERNCSKCHVDLATV